LPVRLGNEYVEAHGRRFTGADLSVITVCRNPLEERRKVVLIGAAELPEANFGTMELAIDGWFDFAIWRKSGNGAALVGAERFAENAPAATATAGR
jgi:hypothetical protein